MKFDVDDKNRCRLVCVKFHLNRCRFAAAVAKCFGGSLFWDTVYFLAMAPFCWGCPGPPKQVWTAPRNVSTQRRMEVRESCHCSYHDDPTTLCDASDACRATAAHASTTKLHLCSHDAVKNRQSRALSSSPRGGATGGVVRIPDAMPRP